MLAATEEREEAGSEEYRGHHFGKILKEGFSFSGFERDHLYRNIEGSGFLDISGVTGIDTDTDGRGSAYVDLDNDGDLDIFRTAFQGKAHHLFKNRVGQDAGFVRITLRGTESGRDAYGTIVRVRTSAGTLTKVKSGGSGFVSQSDPRPLFGLGKDDAAEWIAIDWPSGARSRFEAVPAGSSILAVEGAPAYELVPERHFDLPEPVGEESFLHLLAVGPGEVFPDLPLADTGARETSFARVRGRGRHTLVNLWSTTCVPCRREMPQLEALAPSFRERGLDVVGVSLDMGAARRSVPRTLRKLGVTYPVFTTEESVFPALFAGEEYLIPLTYVVDPGGKIVEVFKGWSDETRERIELLLPGPDAEPFSR